MPTNNRRRTIACLLRHIDMTHDQNWSSVISCLGVTSREKAVLALADLIEPEPERTCHIDMVSSGAWECDVCGGGIDWDSYDKGDPPNCNYCPNCGAKVVAD